MSAAVTNSRARRSPGSTAGLPPLWGLLVGSASILAAVLLSPNPELWVASTLSLLIAIWLVGWPTSYPVLLFVVGINWLQVVADVLSADLSSYSLGMGMLGPYPREAIIWSLCALLALAIGMRLGTNLRVSLRPVAQPITSAARHGRNVSLYRAVLAFFISLLISQAVGVVAFSVPGLQQPVLALLLLKFVCLYLLAATVFELGRGYGWLVLVMLLELVTGITGYFSDYKEAIFILLIAVVATRPQLNGRVWVFAAMTVLLVIWVSLIWTAIKPEYRSWVSGYTGAQTIARPIDERVQFIAQRVLSQKIDYDFAFTKLLRRIGYTEVYAQILARQQAGLIPDISNRFFDAVRHILTPRILFPDKAALDDSAVTTVLTGQEVAENTSISVGYVAEAHVDFGVPGMFLEILLIGAMLGAAARYFMTRAAPLIVRQAFTTACLFSAFRFEANIDKALGAFVVGFIALALVLKFGYPMIAKWLTAKPASHRIVGRSVSRARHP